MSVARTSKALDPDRQYQFLTFMLDGDIYGIDVLQIQEIRAYEKTRLIPEVPDHIKGVLDLRGQIVPVIDLRLRFNLAHAEYTPTTVTIVISVRMYEGSEVVGVVVDGVDDVLSINVDEVRPPPKLGGDQTKTRFMLGMVKSDGAMVMLLDTDKLFDEETIASIEQISE